VLGDGNVKDKLKLISQAKNFLAYHGYPFNSMRHFLYAEGKREIHEDS